MLGKVSCHKYQGANKETRIPVCPKVGHELLEWLKLYNKTCELKLFRWKSYGTLRAVNSEPKSLNTGQSEHNKNDNFADYRSHFQNVTNNCMSLIRHSFTHSVHHDKSTEDYAQNGWKGLKESTFRKIHLRGRSTRLVSRKCSRCKRWTLVQ